MDLDDTDRGILYLLQRDARGISTQSMGERIGVSASTVRNRIEKLEESGVIRGYHPDVDYDEAGLQLHVEIRCSAPNPRREELVSAASDVAGVVSVRELLDAAENVQVDAVGTDSDDVARITDELGDSGLEIVDTTIVKETVVQPFDHFGRDVVEADGAE